MYRALRGAIEGMDNDIRACMRGLVEPIGSAGRCDFMTEVALRYPTAVYMQTMGMPLGDLDVFLGWAERLLHTSAADDPDGSIRARAQSEPASHLRGGDPPLPRRPAGLRSSSSGYGSESQRAGYDYVYSTGTGRESPQRYSARPQPETQRGSQFGRVTQLPRLRPPLIRCTRPRSDRSCGTGSTRSR